MDDHKELSEIDRALVSALDVDVSADFEARVRQRIAGEPMRVPFWRGWRLAVPAVAAAAVVAAIGVAMLSTRDHATPQLLAARSLASVQTRPVAGDPILTRRSAPAVPRVLPLALPAPAPASVMAEAEVLVPREDIEMYRRLIAAAQRVPNALVIESPRDVASIQQISDITIDPIKIDLIIPPVSGEGDRQ